MKKIISISCLLFLIIQSCSDDDKTIDVVINNTEIGAYVRTISINNTEYHIGETSNVFSTLLEVQDEKNGQLLEAIDVYIGFQDNTRDNGDSSISEVLIKTLPKENFELGPFDLPRTTLIITQDEALEKLNLITSDLHCKDQFLVRLVLKLNDGRTFTTGQSSSKIIAFDDFWSSPFLYTINVVHRLEANRFIGTYTMKSINSTTIPPSFGEELEVELTQGHSPNIRVMKLRHRMSILQEQPRIFRFTIACDQTIMGKNLLASKVAFCGKDPSILIGPDTENGPVSSTHNSLFELWFVEGYLGFDGNCGFGTVPIRYQFSQ